MPSIMEYLFKGSDSRIDKTDMKILDALRKDARLPLKELSRLCRVSKQTVLYRTDRLLEKNILRGFHAIINYTALGYDIYYLFIKTRYIEDEESFVGDLAKLKGCVSIMHCLSQYNYTAKIITKDIHSTYSELESFFNKKKNVTTHFMLQRLERQGRLGNNNKNIDDKDRMILDELSVESRLTSLEISRRTGISYETVQLRIRKMVQQRVIEGFTAIIDFKKAGFMDYSILLKFADDSLAQLPLLESQLHNDPLVVRRFKTVGEFGYMFEIIDRDFISINDKINRIRSQFHDMIRSTHIVPIQDHYFYRTKLE